MPSIKSPDNNDGYVVCALLVGCARVRIHRVVCTITTAAMRDVRCDDNVVEYVHECVCTMYGPASHAHNNNSSSNKTATTTERGS